jgi:hypothetical protein
LRCARKNIADADPLIREIEHSMTVCAKGIEK